MDFFNVYEDAKRAESYAKLEFPGTYHLAFRDLPAIFSRHARGRKAIDFGCGTGRSTRVLAGLGFEAVGIDISENMVKLARERDPQGDYRLVGEGGFGELGDAEFDLILSAFTFDNIPTWKQKVELFGELRRLLRGDGQIVNLVSAPEIYTHEWASFTTKDFPENRAAKSGDRVRIVMTDVPDRRPVEDVVWFDEDYRKVYSQSGLDLVETLKPLARGDEPYAWVNETKIAPWVIYVLKRM